MIDDDAMTDDGMGPVRVLVARWGRRDERYGASRAILSRSMIDAVRAHRYREAVAVEGPPSLLTEAVRWMPPPFVGNRR